MISEKYKKHISENENILKDCNSKNSIVGYVRLFLLACTILFFVLLIIKWFSLAFAFFLVCSIIAFVIFSIIHAKISSRIKYCKGMIKINREYLSRINGSWTEFSDDGREFVDYNHNYTNDLDIFGAKSAYQLINLTKTHFGKVKLKNDLSAPNYTSEEITERQNAIKELSNLDKFSHEFEYYGESIKNNDNITKTIKYVKDKSNFIKSEIIQEVLFYLPLLTAAFCLVVFAFNFKVLYPMAYGLIAVQVLIWLVLALKSNNYLSNSENIQYSLERYSQIFKLIENQNFESKILNEIKSCLTGSQASATAATKKLSGILQRIQMRKNGIMYFSLNILFLWDINCCNSLSRWTKKYGQFFENWFISLGELESLLSFSVISNVIDKTCQPQIAEKKHVLNVRETGHPLLQNDKRICNDFVLNKNINIISGSNMSGKTTFLRTLGLNLVLAKNGSYVCAKEMQFSNMEIVSSMRISDDLNEGISTFYSELKKIKRVLEISEHNDNTIFLIDEIFRGTNSLDRIAGAKEVVKKLNGYNAYGFLTTHDLTLCDKINSVEIENYNFSEYYENGELKFNYKINDGIAKTTNGEYLMKIIGIY